VTTNNPQTTQAGATARIPLLLVDDQPFVGMAIARLLATETDLELNNCYEAESAVSVAERVGAKLILQDLVMPNVDGLTLVARFRANPATSATPIVVLSGNDDVANRSRALAAGADDSVVKLPDRAALVSCIRGHLAGRRAAQPPVEAPLDTTPAASHEDTLDLSVIETFRQAGAATGADLITTLIDQFLAETDGRLARLTEAVRFADKDAMKAAVHSLRGASMTMGARRLGALSAQLEHALHRNPEQLLRSVDLGEITAEAARVRQACLEQRARPAATIASAR
jgi:DNA-binding response OmpR family regulator